MPLDGDAASSWWSWPSTDREALSFGVPVARVHGRVSPQESEAEIAQRACDPVSPKQPVRGRLDRAVVLTANEQLNLPMGFGRMLVVAGRRYLFCLEPHYHPPGGGITPEGWHKGVTVYYAEPPKERVL